MIKAGVYEHYKGGKYLVLGLAIDTNADEFMVNDPYGSLFSNTQPLGGCEVVVYVGLNNRNDEPHMFVRTVKDFNQLLCGVGWEEPGKVWAYCHKKLNARDQCPDHGHMNVRHTPRFEYVGPNA